MKLVVVVLVTLLFVVATADAVSWDTQGYILYCPCMGRFGNQAAHFLGALAFAKELNRTLTLPPWRTYKNVPFKDWFKPEAVQEYHKALPLEDFLEHFGEDKWPVGQRIGYCYRSHKPHATDCEMKEGNPFGPFWNELGVNFDKSEFTYLTYDTTIKSIKEQWMTKYSPHLHPVLAFKGAPASFPVKPHHRQLQRYLKWSDTINTLAVEYINDVMGGAKFIGIHMRIGSDWNKACEHAVGLRSFMESLQCLEDTPDITITNELCFPSISQVVDDILKVSKHTNIYTIYIASDSKPNISELEQKLGSKIKLYFLSPERPQVDLAILGKSNYFIGNCVSSFSAFVKRERDVFGKPSTFWGHKKLNTLKEEL